MKKLSNGHKWYGEQNTALIEPPRPLGFVLTASNVPPTLTRTARRKIRASSYLKPQGRVYSPQAVDNTQLARRKRRQPSYKHDMTEYTLTVER